MDLDMDCHLTILEKMDLDGLIAMTNVNQRFKMVAGNVFRRQYSSKIKFMSPNNLPRRNVDKELRVERFIWIFDFEMVSKILRNFNLFITSIVIELPQYHKREADLLALINDYCAETLTNIEFQAPLSYYHQSIYFDVLKTPFPKVKSLTISGGFNAIRTIQYNRTFSELFPSVEQICFHQFSTLDFGFIGNEFPQLTHLYADVIAKVTQESRHGYELKLEDFFRANSKIQSLTLKYSSQDLLRIVGQQLQHLENLTLISHIDNLFNETDRDLTEIRLDQVKRLTVREGGRSMPHQPLSMDLVEFGNLEEFETDAKPHCCLNWIDFVAKKRHLHKLTLSGRFIEQEQFARIAEINRDLVEFNGRFHIGVHAETIVKFIRNNQNLTKMHLEFSATADQGDDKFATVANALRENFGECADIRVVQELFEIFFEKSV